MRSTKRKCVLMKDVIVHRKNNATTSKIIITKRYMYLWHVCLIMTNVPVGLSVMDLRFRRNVSYDARGFGFYSWFVIQYG